MAVERALPQAGACANGNDATMQRYQPLRSSRVVPCPVAQAVDSAAAARIHPRRGGNTTPLFASFRLMTCNGIPRPVPQVSPPGLNIPARRKPV